MSRYFSLFGLCVAMTLAVMTPLGASGAHSDVATLKKIASRVDDRTGVVSIEASAPVPYVASQPDPHSFVIELREVAVPNVANQFVADPRSPISALQVEQGRDADGADVARVRMTLRQAMRPRVRSARNVIYVEADRDDKPVTAADAVAMGSPSSVIRDVRVARRGDATAVTLLGTGRLVTSSVDMPKDGPAR